MLTNLDELYRLHSNKVSDKWSLYLNEYDRILFSDRAKTISLLEIGICW